MAGASINFTYPIGEKSIGGFVIDAFLVESYNYANRLTNLTVEEGSNVSDHVVEEPDTIDIEAFIGQTKFETNANPPGADIDLSEIEIPDDPKSRIRQAYHELLRMKRERQPVDVVTGLDTFTDMVITTFNISRDVETGEDLPFTMSFQNIKIVKSEETEISASSGGGAGDQAGGAANVGTAGKTNTTEDDSFKERWRQWVRSGRASPAEYQEQWGVPFPQ
jgi:hypothetical protein